MYLIDVKMWNFRLFGSCFASFSPGINIICGDNASGKTSILESVYALCLTKAIRGKKDCEMVKWGEKFSLIKGNLMVSGKTTQMQFSMSENGKIVKMSGKECKNISSYIGYANVVLFCPEDLMIVKGGPSERRRFMDVEMGQISPNYLRDLIEYKELLRQRNALLKQFSLEKPTPNNIKLLDVIDKRLVEAGSKIIISRAKFIEMLTPIAHMKLQAISGASETLEMTQIVSTSVEEYARKMEESRESDVAKGSTSFGPHRDDISFKINGRDTATYGSQGQQRSVVLALKLSLVDLFSKIKKDLPILLLDDVFSELDETRQNEIIKLIGKGIQAFITTTSISELDKRILKNANILNLNNERRQEA